MDRFWNHDGALLEKVPEDDLATGFSVLSADFNEGRIGKAMVLAFRKGRPGFDGDPFFLVEFDFGWSLEPGLISRNGLIQKAPSMAELFCINN